MTTIAYARNVMAADSQITFSDGSRLQVKKLRRLPDGSIFGGAGDVPAINKLERWAGVGLVKRRRPRFGKAESADAILIKPDGSIWMFGAAIDPEKIEAEFIAIGSGSDFAMGAMAAGRSAVEAVKIAAQYDINTSEPIETIRLELSTKNAAK